jgi:hypothetical protein
MSREESRTLANLKADCVLIRGLTEAYPNNRHFANAYEFIQRKIETREREVFCDIQEPR